MPHFNLSQSLNCLSQRVIYDETVLMAVLHPCTQTSPDIYIHAHTHSVICNGCLENQINMPCYGVLTRQKVRGQKSAQESQRYYRFKVKALLILLREAAKL